MNLFKQLMTGRDNETHDLGRWSWFASFVAVIGHSIWNTLSGVPVKLTDLAMALAAVAGAHGVALGMKKDTEPAEKEDTEEEEK